MSDVVIFKPKFKTDAKQNLKGFIEFAEKLPALNDEMKYDSNLWERAVRFIKFGVSSKNSEVVNQLDPSIMSFAKAYVIYSQTQNRTKNVTEIVALRAIEGAMMISHGSVDITKINAAVFDNAAQVLREALCKSAANKGGGALLKLQKFLTSKNIISKFTWKNPIKRHQELVSKVSAEGAANRMKKLPDEDALMAISEIFNLDKNQLSSLDIFTTSSIALLLCAPARGSELFYLKSDCLYYDKDSKGKEVVGLKWYSGKGFGYEVEWIPDVMVSVAEKAVKRLNRLSKSAREWAKKMELLIDAVNTCETPTFPRHNLCPDVPSDSTLLTLGQTANALGYGKKPGSGSYLNGAKAFLKHRGYKVIGWKSNDKKYCLRDLIPKLIEGLPKTFPYVKYRTGGNDLVVKWSEALYCANSYEYITVKNTIVTELWMGNISYLNEDLSKTKKRNRKIKKMGFVNVQSVFERYDFYHLYTLTSHQLRHMLTTIAKVNGMKDQVLTKWAGRADEKHNRVYNHTTPEQYKDKAVLIQPRKSSGELGLTEFEICAPETLQEINTRSSQTAHVTEFGACVHDYIMAPCSKHRDCINCDEQVCVKGDDVKLERLRKRLDRENMLIEGDKKAMGDDLLNADRHYHKRLVTIRRCEELIRVLSDENVPDGSLIKLSIASESHLDLVMDKNHKKRLPKMEKHQQERVVTLTKTPKSLTFYKRKRRYN